MYLANHVSARMLRRIASHAMRRRGTDSGVAWGLAPNDATTPSVRCPSRGMSMVTASSARGAPRTIGRRCCEFDYARRGLAQKVGQEATGASSGADAHAAKEDGPDTDCAGAGADKGEGESGKGTASDSGSPGGRSSSSGEKPDTETNSNAGEEAKSDSVDEGPDQAEPAKQKLSPEAKAQQLVDDLTQKQRDAKHKLLLSLADFQNAKKKYTSEREARRHRGLVNFSTKMVEVYVDFENQIEPPKDGVSESYQALHEGIVMTHGIYRDTMEKFGLTRVAPDVGSPMAADRYDSVGSVEVDGATAAPDTVGEVVQAGWVLDMGNRGPTRVLHKARVKAATPAAEPGQE